MFLILQILAVGLPALLCLASILYCIDQPEYAKRDYARAFAISAAAVALLAFLGFRFFS